MKSIRKFLIASIILITIGIAGLISGGIIFSLSSPVATFGTGTGYTFGPGNMMGMMRGFNSGKQYIDLKNISFDEVKSAGEKYLSDIGLQNVKIKEIMELL